MKSATHKLRDPPDIRDHGLTRTRPVKNVLFAQLLEHPRSYVSSGLHPLHHRLLLATLLPQVKVIHPTANRSLGWGRRKTEEPGSDHWSSG
ncbi:hypothetical protein VIGAN_01034400 [Vigna angularis var. angularis]|uniref:Uncharacterized protein n=1 Tax=Vigna angularis var. angularis TaxID=157739 RepID=A0A0S3QX90_PHAAN|nr:hypothetical protein VIGAN_01034400 [Vigna angularis var. angularis]